jgi:hypothetical protein
MSRAAVWAWFLLFHLGCHKMSADRYPAEKVQIESTTREGDEVRIVYRVPLESVFFSPGVQTTRVDADTVVVVARCGIKDTCPVAHKAVPVGSAYEVRLPLPPGGLFLDTPGGVRLAF